MCDIRLAATDAVFALPEATIGMAVDAGGEMRLAREIAANAPLAVQAIKRSVDTFADRGLAEAMGQAALLAAEFERK